MHEVVFCRIMKLNKWICAKKKVSGIYFYKGHDEVKRRPTQLNSSPIGARNQRRFASNPSPIGIMILVYSLPKVLIRKLNGPQTSVK